jgi:para-nitrobenzyl esterase
MLPRSSRTGVITMTSNRRRFFQVLGTGAAGMTIGGSGMASASAGSDKTGTEDDGPVLQIGDHIAVTDTQHGKVRGYVLRGIH